MTTARGDDARHSDDETRVDVPVTGASDAPADNRPPAFPSVGGTAGNESRAHDDAPPPIERSSELPPLLPAFASTDGAAGPVLTAPVGGRNSPWRWVAVLVATLAIVALIGGFFVFLGPRPGTPSLVSQYAPADAAAYAELRLDLPGDQRERLISFMSNFPGFADPATFQQKIDDTLQQALRGTDTGLDWKADVDPWFGGQIGLFSSTLAPTQGMPPSFSVVLSVKDRAKLDDLINARLTGSGMESEDYDGQTIWSGKATEESGRFSFAVTDEALVVSTRNEDLKGALDVKRGDVDGLAEAPFFTAELASLHSDRLAAFYYDYATLLQSLPTGAASALPQSCMDDIRAAAGIKLLGEVRAESDHMAVTMRSQIPSGGNLPPAAPNKRTALAESLPADTIAYVELRQVGALLKSGAEQALSCLAPALGGFDVRQLEGLIGTAPQDYFNFIGDAAIAVTSTDGRLGGGLIATVDDENVARIRLERLLSVARLGTMAGDITIEEQQHGAATITVIKFGGGLFPLAETPSIAVTITGGRLYLGVDDFVSATIDRAAAGSLASAPRLQAALTAAGSENAGVVYLNITALRGAIEGNMPAESRTGYDTEVKPFLEPITHLIMVNRTESGINVGHAFLYVE